MRWLLQRQGQDPLLLSRIGYVQLALGHVGPAEATFARAAAIAATPTYGTDKEVQAAVRRNQALLLTANQDYKGTAGCPTHCEALKHHHSVGRAHSNIPPTPFPRFTVDVSVCCMLGANGAFVETCSPTASWPCSL